MNLVSNSSRLRGPARDHAVTLTTQTAGDDMATTRDPQAGNIGLGPHDAGLGGIRPDQAIGLGPHDAGLGGIRPDQAIGLGPHDAGLGGIRQRDQR